MPTVSAGAGVGVGKTLGILAGKEGQERFIVLLACEWLRLPTPPVRDFRARSIHLQIPSGTGRLSPKQFRKVAAGQKKTKPFSVLLHLQPGLRYVTVKTGVRAVIKQVLREEKGPASLSLVSFQDCVS